MPPKSKKKRANEAKDEDEEGPSEPVFVGSERYDADAVRHISELVLDETVEAAINAIDSFATFGMETRRKVEYNPPESFKFGRVYGTGLQSLAGWARRIIAHKYYHDIDMVNAGVTIYRHLVQRGLGLCPPILQEYVNDRLGVFAKVRAELDEPLSDGQLKTWFIQALYGGDTRAHPSANRSNTLDGFREEIVATSTRLTMIAEHKITYDDIVNDSTKKNKLGTFVSRICETSERLILLALVDHFTQNGRRVGVLIHDGMLVERDDKMPMPNLRDAEIFVRATTGFPIKLIEKSMTPTQEDWELYHGEKALHKIKKPMDKAIHVLVTEARKGAYKRMDDDVYIRHATIPGVYLIWADSQTFINDTLMNYSFSRGIKIKELQVWFACNDHEHFEILRKQKNLPVIAFRNGYLDLEALHFHAYVETTGGKILTDEGKEPPLTTHYFDQDFDLSSTLRKETPLWDDFCSTQLGPRSVCCECGTSALVVDNDGVLWCREHVGDRETRMRDLNFCDNLEVLIGRLFFRVGLYDEWQLMPLLLGVSGSGKSTLLDIIRAMFPVGSVGCIVAEKESTFGLEGLMNKRLVCIPDLPKNMSKVLTQSTFQSLTSGDLMTVNRKHLTPIMKPWEVQMIAAGNYLCDYEDTSGALARRLAVVRWTKLVENKDTGLKRKIIASELVTVLLRCVVMYRNTCAQFKDVDYWKFAPSELKEAQSDVRTETSRLSAFLSDGDEYYQVLRVEGEVTPLADLKRAFGNHMRFVHKVDKATIGKEQYYHLEIKGFIVDRLNLCKTCHLQHTLANCKEHYDADNRYRKEAVVNMRIKCIKSPPAHQPGSR